MHLLLTLLGLPFTVQKYPKKYDAVGLVRWKGHFHHCLARIGLGDVVGPHATKISITSDEGDAFFTRHGAPLVAIHKKSVFHLIYETLSVGRLRTRYSPLAVQHDVHAFLHSIEWHDEEHQVGHKSNALQRHTKAPHSW